MLIAVWGDLVEEKKDPRRGRYGKQLSLFTAMDLEIDGMYVMGKHVYHRMETTAISLDDGI